MDANLKQMNFVFVLFYTWVTGHANIIGPSEYCMLDVFEPRCPEGEVIIMENAIYGRMTLGKCITQNVGPMKCYADVKAIMDTFCSGRGTCSVDGSHRSLIETNPCSTSSFSSYLRASYSCKPVINKEKTCSSGFISNSPSGFISAMDHPCPIKIHSPNDQVLNFTIYNFLNKEHSLACYEIATISEGNNKRGIHVCPSDPRIKVAYVSSGSAVTVDLSTQVLSNEVGLFLLHYTAHGCPSPPVPDNAHAIREGDTATIVCNNSDTTWTTTCKDNTWTQQDRECPASWTFTGIVKSSQNFPYGIFLTSIIGVSVGVLIGGFLLFLAINAFQRYQRRGQQYGPPPVIPDPDYKIYDTARMDLSFVPGFGPSTLPRHQMAAADVPPAPPPLSQETMKRLSRHTYERPNFPPP